MAIPVLSNLLALPTQIKMYALMGVAAVVITAGAYGSGYLVGQRNLAEKTVTGQTKEVVKWQTQIQKQQVEVKVRDIAREQKLATDLANVSAERDSLKEILREKPDPDPSVYLRLGDVRLLNDAANNGAPVTSLSDPTRFASYQEQTPSIVELRSFVGTELDIRAQYNALAKQHDALVDWVNVELIDQQLKPKK